MATLASLPPKVDGLAQGYLDIKVGQVLWLRRASTPIDIKITWWGEEKSQILKINSKNSTGNLITYEIHTSYKLFRYYLLNCEQLTLSVIDNLMGNLIGTCKISNIASVISDVPHESFHSILNEFNHVIGNLHVGFRLCMSSSSKTLRQNILQETDRSTSSKTNDMIHSGIESTVSNSLVDKLLLQGQKLRNSMIETILDNDPLNKEVYSIDKIDSDRSNRTRSGIKLYKTDNSGAESHVLAYLLGEDMSENDEKQAVETIKNVSPASSIIGLASDLAFKNGAHGSQVAYSRSVSDFAPSENSTESTDNSVKSTILKYVNSLKIYIYNIKLNSAGERKIHTLNTAHKFRSDTFFVEYNIPTILTQGLTKTKSKVNSGLNNERTVRFCSKKHTNGALYFKQCSVHNITNIDMLNLSNIFLEVNIHWRTVAKKGTVLIGVARYNFSDLIRQPNFSSNLELVVLDPQNPIQIGSLKISIQFGCDKLHFGKDFLDAISCNKENRNLSENDSITKSVEAQSIRIPKIPDNTDLNKKIKELKKIKTQKSKNVGLVQNISTNEIGTQSYNKDKNGVKSSESGKNISTNEIGIETYNKDKNEIKHQKSHVNKPINDLVDDFDVFLNTEMPLLQGLIFISEAEYDYEFGSTFLTCRAFWKEDSTSSKICHHTQRAVFDFRELIPILYDSDFLTRIKNNFIIIEVWKTDESVDTLIGLCRLILHRFYVAYRNPRIARYQVDCKFPVIGFDDWETIYDPYTQTKCGRLKALLAIGTESQIRLIETARSLNNPVVVGCSPPKEITANLSAPISLKVPQTQSQISFNSRTHNTPVDYRLSEAVVSNSRNQNHNSSKKKTDTSLIKFNSDLNSDESEVSDKLLKTKYLKKSVEKVSRSVQTDKDADMENVRNDVAKQNAPVEGNTTNRAFQNDLLASFLETLATTRLSVSNNRTQTEASTEQRFQKLNRASQTQNVLNTSVSVDTLDLTSNIDSGIEIPKVMSESSSAHANGSQIRETSKLLESLQQVLSAPPPNLTAFSMTTNNFRSDDENKISDTSKSQQKQSTERNMFKAHVIIENAMHLAIRKRRIRHKSKHGKRSEAPMPSTYVSFEPIPNKGTLFTTVIQKSTNPTWDQHFETYLPTDLLFDDQKRLIFKVWNKIGGNLNQPTPANDSVIGFAAVDLTVLPVGLPVIQGWFNIMDLSNRCNGQIKINVTPLENIDQFKDLSVNNSVSNTPPLPINQSPDFFESSTTSLLSNALKRKFTELDEITERLKQRLMNVTNNDIDDKDEFDTEFERDLNTQCNDDSTEVDFSKIFLPNLQGENVEMEITETVANLKDNDREINKYLNNETANQKYNTSVDRHLTEPLSVEIGNIDSEPNIDESTDLAFYDSELKQSKQRFSTLFEKLTLHAEALSANTAGPSYGELINKADKTLDKEFDAIFDSIKSLDNIDEENSASESGGNSNRTENLIPLLSLSSDSDRISDLLNSDNASDDFRSVSETFLRQAPDGAGNTSEENVNKIGVLKDNGNSEKLNVNKTQFSITSSDSDSL